MKAASTQRRFRVLLWQTALLPMVLAMGASLLLAALVGQLLRRAQWVDHTDQVIAQAKSCQELGMLMRISLSESPPEGGNGTARYHSYSKQLQGELDRLAQLVADNPAQERRLEDLRSAFAAWQSSAEATLKSPRPEGNHAATPEGTGSQSAFDRFTTGLNQFVQVEEGLRERRTAAFDDLNKNVRRWRLIILLSGGLLLSAVLCRQLMAMAKMFQQEVALERQRHQAQARLAAIVKSSEDAIIAKDLSGIMTAWNEGAERMFGYREQEALGKPITLVFPPERHAEEPAILEAIRSGQRIDHYETVRVGKQGRRLEVSCSVSPIHDQNGEVVGASTILRDISRLKHDQEELRQARDALEQRVRDRTRELTQANERLKDLDRYRSEFLSAMSHELRTPLNSIIGFTEILKEGRAGPINEKQGQYLGMAYGSAKHLLTLINDLLDLSRIEAGKEELFIEPFEVETVLKSALQGVQLTADTKHLRLESNLGFGGRVLSDRKKFYQIVLNLLANAVKFTDQGEVRLESWSENGDVRVSVMDTGIGMTPEQLTTLFQQFRRLEHPAQRLYEGAGLGLYLCKKLVTLLGGEIWAESQQGKGSRFTFRIPKMPTHYSHGEAQDPVN